MNQLLILLIGFSVIASAVLYSSYALFLHNLNRSPRALITGALLLTGFAALQLGHLDFLTTGNSPLGSLTYRFWLFICPTMFYLFSRSILFDEQAFDWRFWLHTTPALLIFIPQTAISISILFCIGTGYSLWLTQLIYNLRGSRQRSRFELFFLVLFSVMAIGVLILGFSLPYMDEGYFYRFYAFGIGLALILVVAVLLSFPELLSDLAEAAKRSYAVSTLNDVDVPTKQQMLDQLMLRDKVYEQEDLSLASLAEAVELSPHQLSELINTQYAMSFSQYVREHRIRAAQQLLKAEPAASILSIGMQVGFKSQSNFYAAFKAYTGQSPGAYRGKGVS